MNKDAHFDVDRMFNSAMLVYEDSQQKSNKSDSQSKHLKCPLCNKRIRSYFINSNQKLFMCSNKKKNFHELTANKHECEAVEILLAQKLQQQKDLNSAKK